MALINETGIETLLGHNDYTLIDERLTDLRLLVWNAGKSRD